MICRRNMWFARIILRHVPRICCTTNFSTVNKEVKIGCASGFWGDTPTAAPQLIHYGGIDFLMFDYLSEITMSLLTAARAKDPQLGYAPDFVQYAVGPHLAEIKRKGIRVISNAGGINPHGCASSLAAAAKKAGVEMKIAVVSGDNIIKNKEAYIKEGVRDMESGLPLPESVVSMNAYLGAGPIVQALEMGADIVVTGRCTDSALALGPLMHSHGWKPDDFDKLVAGSLAGHLIECGAQVTGGIFTDWWKVPEWHRIVASVDENGTVRIGKPPNTGGLVSKGTVSEQLLYEIGDPAEYILPDVICDFSWVTLEEEEDQVVITGARGKKPTDFYKVCATYLDGYRAMAVCGIGGINCKDKARKTGMAILERCREIFKFLKLPDFTRTHLHVIGSEDSYGSHACTGDLREGAIWIAVHHYNKQALQIFSREIAAAGTGMAPGLTTIIGGRPKPTPLLRLHSFLVPKKDIKVDVECEGHHQEYVWSSSHESRSSHDSQQDNIPATEEVLPRGKCSYPLNELVYARSGDKGNTCNIGVIARTRQIYPYLKEKLTEAVVAEYFKHVFPEDLNPEDCVIRYELQGLWGLNFVLRDSLGGGGVASLRYDPQGKAFAQMLLSLALTDMPNHVTLGLK